MNSTLPRDGLRPRARRLLARLAAVLVVGALLGSGAPAASADDQTAPEATDPAVTLFVSTGAGAQVEPGGPMLTTVTIENGTTTDLSAGSVTIEVNPTALPDSAALDTWLDEGTAPGAFRTVATEATPVVADDSTGTMNAVVDAEALGQLAPGVYPLRARLSGALTTDADGDPVPWNLSATSALVIAPAAVRRTAVLVPLTATPESGALLTADELATLTGEGGDLAGQLDAVTGTSAILAVDPAIPAAIRMLGAAAPATATQWLTELESLPNDMFALQFADADATVQAKAGRAALLGAPDLTPLLDPAAFPAAEAQPAPTAEASPTPVPTAEPVLPDNEALTAIRGAQPDILWPRPGASADDLAAFAGYLGDRTTTVLPSSAVTAKAPVHSAVGSHDLLIADTAASARLSAAVQLSDTAAIDRELTAAAGHLFYATRSSPVVALALDRSESRSPVALRDALSAFATAAVNLNGLRAGAPTTVDLVSPGEPSRVPALQAMLASEERLTAFATILDEPALLLTPDRIRVLRAIGVGLTDEQFAARTTAHGERVATTLSAVSVQRPKPVQLFTSAAPLPVWVRNELPWPVTVNLYSAPSDNRLDIQPVTKVTALASSSTRVDVPIEARVASGQVDVRFHLESPTGVPIGQPEVADVTLRADWEGIGLGILGGVIALLLVFGVVRTVRRKRADAAAAAPQEDR
ncbi:DUF6049 family protein [Microbacterium sp. USHLN186]|uniref:DUF6049 family protein n=1 Tax=Microbacterium sp. USHLN186 TaxID=3081286 RepID=UPI003016B0E9